jgi:hypothetical protein
MVGMALARLCPPYALDCFVATRLAMTVHQTRLCIPAAPIASESCKHIVAQKTEGAGKAGCWSHPQPGVRKMKAHQPSRHRFNRVIPALPARVVLTVSFVLSPVSMTS